MVQKIQIRETFLRYAEAVNADRFRVTSVRMHPDGSKQTLILDKQHGVTCGFTPYELVHHIAEMQRLQARGENIYYTPLSEHKHHLLIDDVDRDTLANLIHDGHRPAVLLESSPGNYQVVMTIPKCGTPHDKAVGNRLTALLNQQYGDAKLSGAIHPHRAPGYQNRKPKHRRDDGTYPEVRLLKAERRECAKTFALARAMVQVCQPSDSRPTPPLETRRTHEGSGDETVVDAYYRHAHDVLRRYRETMVDWSRLDAMVALRLRVTGHSQIAVEQAIRHGAPVLRQTDDRHDWDDYAQRTARYAYGAAGDRQLAQWSKHRAHWTQLERTAR